MRIVGDVVDINFLVGDFTDDVIIGLRDSKKLGLVINCVKSTILKDDLNFLYL